MSQGTLLHHQSITFTLCPNTITSRVSDLIMKSKLDIDWAAMKWSIDSFVESVGAFQDAEKVAGGMNGVPLVYFS